VEVQNAEPKLKTQKRNDLGSPRSAALPAAGSGQAGIKATLREALHVKKLTIYGMREGR
jgi:hypothetical protein